MQYLLWIMASLILLAGICIYIIPAGQFGTNKAGQVMEDSFSYLGYQTPASPWRAIFLFSDGLTGPSLIILTVMTMGANVTVILGANAVDDFLDWAVYKLKDKGEGILISTLFCLMVYLDGFGGSDALIAVVPTGLLSTRKLRLDSIVAIGVTTYATLTGSGTGPTKQVATQMLMDMPVYSAFGARFFFMNLSMVIGLVPLLRYVKKVERDPTKSLMYGAGQDPNQVVAADKESNLTKETGLTWRTVAIMTIFFGQYFIIVLFGGGGAGLYNFVVAVSLVGTVVAGIIRKMSANQLVGVVAKGLTNMAFVRFVIGPARVVGLVMAEGSTIRTVVYALTRPLMGLPKSVSSIGMTVIIAIINPFIPSATSRAVIPVPIIKPIAETLHLTPQLVVQAFQSEGGFTNLISPALRWTVGSCAIANVPFDKWSRWVLPEVVFFMALSSALMFVLTSIDWGIQAADGRKKQQINQDVNRLIMEEAKEYESCVIQQQRHFHMYAEVTAKEFKTSKYLKEEAAKLDLPIQELKGTGFVTTLDMGRPRKILTIHSDIDALPMDEDSENLKGPKTCISVSLGACHVCGHDAHMAIALGAMKVLCDIREQLSGKILSVFEEGEEQDTGWPVMSEALITRKVNAIYGNHVTAFMDVGTFCVDEGSRMAGAIDIEVAMNGKSGHGSRPNLAVSPIVVASQIVTQLSTTQSTKLGVTKTVTLSVCMFQAGHIPDIIPDSAFLGGSCRYSDIEESHKAATIIEQVVEGVATVNKCTVTFRKRQGIVTTSITNTPELAQLSQKGIQETMPKGSLIHDMKWFASESFSRHYNPFPCMFNFIGMRNEERGCGTEHHNRKFDIDEGALQNGMAAMAKFAVDFLVGGKGEADGQ